MSKETNVTSTAAYAGGAVIFGILMSGLMSDALSDQPYWLRITATAITAGVLAGAFVFIVIKLSRSGK